MLYLGTDGPLNVYLNNYVLYKRTEQEQLFQKIGGLLASLAGDAGAWLADYNRVCDSLKKIEEGYRIVTPSSYGWILENERMSYNFGNIFIRYWGKTMDDSLRQKLTKHKSYLLSNSGSAY